MKNKNIPFSLINYSLKYYSPKISIKLKINRKYNTFIHNNYIIHLVQKISKNIYQFNICKKNIMKLFNLILKIWNLILLKKLNIICNMLDKLLLKWIIFTKWILLIIEIILSYQMFFNILSKILLNLFNYNYFIYFN